VALSRLTKGVGGGSFTLNARIVFGNGCDRPAMSPVLSPWRPDLSNAPMCGIVGSEVRWSLNCGKEITNEINRIGAEADRNCSAVARIFLCGATEGGNFWTGWAGFTGIGSGRNGRRGQSGRGRTRSSWAGRSAGRSHYYGPTG